MSKSKSPKRVFLVSLASSDSETTKERIFRLFASLFQCSRVAVSAIPRADESNQAYSFSMFFFCSTHFFSLQTWKPFYVHKSRTNFDSSLSWDEDLSSFYLLLNLRSSLIKYDLEKTMRCLAMRKMRKKLACPGSTTFDFLFRSLLSYSLPERFSWFRRIRYWNCGLHMENAFVLKLPMHTTVKSLSINC